MHFISPKAALILSSLSLVPSANACLGLDHAHIAKRGNATSSTPSSSNQTSNAIATAEVRIVPRPPRSKTALENVRVFDGYTVQPASTVYFDDDTIVASPDNVDHVIDGRGGILLPGLVDAHSHPNKISDLEIFSSYGVTTVLNMACQEYAQCAAMREQTGLTSFFSAGWNAIGPNSAHAMAQNLPPERLINSTTQVPQWVDHVFGNGSDWLKVTAETNGPDQDVQNLLVLYTHARGYQSMTHAADLEHYIGAIVSQSDGLQHIPADGLLNSTMLAQMRAQGQYATPTMYVFRELLPQYSTLDPGAAPVNATAAYQVVQENVRRVRAAGIPILAGTDSIGVDNAQSGYPFKLPFGSSLHQELWNLVDAGLQPAEALRAATVNPAMSHKLGKRGVIAPGMRADLLLLDPEADPLKNINDTLKIARVWNGGLEYMNVTRAS